MRRGPNHVHTRPAYDEVGARTHARTHARARARTHTHTMQRGPNRAHTRSANDEVGEGEWEGERKGESISLPKHLRVYIPGLSQLPA